MSKEFEDLLGQYWDLAHLEGKSGVSQGDKANEVLHALKKLAEQQAQQQEPIAWIERDMQCDDFDPDSVTCEKPDIAADGWEWVPLYTSPPASKPWVGLTDEQFKKIKASLSHQEGWDGDGWDLALKEAIEAKLKEKNT